MAEDNTGIGTGIGSMPQVASAPTAPPTTVQTFLDTQKAIRDRKILATNMDAVAARKAELANYLGATDYAKKLADAQGMQALPLRAEKVLLARCPESFSLLWLEMRALLPRR